MLEQLDRIVNFQSEFVLSDDRTLIDALDYENAQNVVDNLQEEIVDILRTSFHTLKIMYL